MNTVKLGDEVKQVRFRPYGGYKSRIK